MNVKDALEASKGRCQGGPCKLGAGCSEDRGLSLKGFLSCYFNFILTEGFIIYVINI